MTVRFLSLFSGIEAASQAWLPLGWECVAVCEFEAAPSSVLAHRHPNVPNLGDVTKVTEVDIMALGQIDLVVFGSPCQDLSVAGKRKGLQGARSGLFHTAINIVQWARDWGDCRFALWENVPGAFTSNEGRDFAAVVDALAGLEPGTTEVPPKGWGNEGAAIGEEAMVEWATLDAQWFGVAQRRRRVFALADFGDWASRPPILLEPESLRGDSAPRRGSQEDVAGTITTRIGNGCPGGGDAEHRLVLTSTGDVAHCLNAGGMGRIDYETETMVVCATGDVTHTLKADGFGASEDGTGRGTPIIAFVKATNPHSADEVPRFEQTDVAATLNGWDERHTPPKHLIAFNSNAQPDQMDFDPHVTAPLTTSQYAAICEPQYGVRRLIPAECERLQGFPDGHTAVPYRGKPMADGPRYKALGNSMAVPVMHWIGQQIDFVWRWH